MVSENRVVELLDEKIEGLQSSIDKLASKADVVELSKLIAGFQSAFFAELKSRDDKIAPLENLVALQSKRLDDIVATCQSLPVEPPLVKEQIDLAIVDSSIVRHVDNHIESLNPGKRN